MVSKGKVTLSMPDSLKNRARAQAILQGRDLSEVVRTLLEMWLEGKIELPELPELRKEDIDKG